MFFSSRGTIKRSHPRRFVPHLLHVRLIFFGLEIVGLIVKTILSAQPDKIANTQGCESGIDTPVIVARIDVIITWLIFFSVLVAAVVYLDPCHLYSAKVNFSSKFELESIVPEDNEVMVQSPKTYQRWKLTHTVWEKRFRVLCCFAGSDESHQAAYREVSEIFAYLFYDSNLVISDIAAGLILLQKEHLARELSMGSATEHQHSISVNFLDPFERKMFQDCLHYVKFAVGIYSWPIHVYMNPLKGCCRLYSNISCRNRTRNNIHEDNSCYCGLAGFVSNTEVSVLDIIYARFENDVYRTPFIVCLDHETQSVVVAIRGTLSRHDLITDLTACGHLIQLPDWPQFMVHKGMYQTAQWIKEYLDDGILDEAFSKVPNYKLVLTGHSLGSGCAGILAILYKERFPDLHCYCYSPTGSLLNSDAATYSQSFVTSVTLGQDLVCRLSIRTAHQLKRDVIRVLENCQKPKYRILLEGILETLGKCCGRDILFRENYDVVTRPNSTELLPDDSETDTVPLILPESTNAFSLEPPSAMDNGGTVDVVPQLYPPGKIIHIVDTLEERQCFFAQRQLEARWSSANSFEYIVVSPDMLRDHLPDVLYRAMKNVWEDKQELSQIVIEEHHH